MGVCSSEPDPPNPNQIDLTHFDIGITLGRGGFGKVHAVQDRLTHQWFAMKRMSKAMILEQQSLALVLEEREVMKEIRKARNPFLCSLLYAFQNDKEIFIITQFMQGGDFTYQIHQQENHRFREQAVRFYVAEIILGLEALHGLNFLYRDLKPENLLLDLDGHLRLSDFGLSVRLQGNNGKIRHRAGTPGYMAPELLMGNSYGFSADIYSLGCTTYELLHGQLPIPAKTFVNISKEAAKNRKLWHYSMKASLSPECQSLLKGLLCFYPEKRLGCGKDGWDEIKSHPWFNDFDWKKAMRKELKAPVLPSQDRPNT
jgi:serine/threonine protein kinase